MGIEQPERVWSEGGRTLRWEVVRVGEVRKGRTIFTGEVMVLFFGGGMWKGGGRVYGG